MRQRNFSEQHHCSHQLSESSGDEGWPSFHVDAPDDDLVMQKSEGRHFLRLLTDIHDNVCTRTV